MTRVQEKMLENLKQLIPMRDQYLKLSTQLHELQEKINTLTTQMTVLEKVLIGEVPKGTEKFYNIDGKIYKITSNVVEQIEVL